MNICKSYLVRAVCAGAFALVNCSTARSDSFTLTNISGKKIQKESWTPRLINDNNLVVGKLEDGATFLFSKSLGATTASSLGYSFTANGINNSGDIVGNVETYDSETYDSTCSMYLVHPAHSGAAEEQVILKTFADSCYHADMRINNQGDVAYVVPELNDTPDTIVIRASNGDIHEIPFGSGLSYQSGTLQFNDLGRVIFTAEDEDYENENFSYTASEGVRFVAPGESFATTYALALSDSDVALYGSSSSSTAVYLYDFKTGQAKAIKKNGATITANGMNNKRQIVGSATDLISGKASSFVYTPGKGFTDLNCAVPNSSRLALTSAWGITDSGTILSEASPMDTAKLGAGLRSVLLSPNKKSDSANYCVSSKVRMVGDCSKFYDQANPLSQTQYFAPGTTCTIQVTLRDASGKPVPNAQVVLNGGDPDYGTTQRLATGRTGSNGVARIQYPLFNDISGYQVVAPFNHPTLRSVSTKIRPLHL